MSIIRPNPTAAASLPRRIVLPFINSDPLLDIQWLILLLPIWWWLGIEQFVWPVALSLSALKMIALQGYRLTIVPPVKWFGLYIMAILISSLFIIENYRWLTYFRNFGAYLSAFLVLLIATNRVRTWRSINLLVNAMFIPLLIAGILGILAVYDIWRPSFESVIGGFLPGSVADTSYGSAIVSRSLGVRGWFTGVGEYFRLTTFFLFANHYASALIYIIPFLFHKLTYGTLPKKIAIGAGIILLLANLFYTTSRVAMVALAAGAIYFILFQSLHRRLIRVLAAVGLTIATLIVLLGSLIDLSNPGQSGLITPLTESINAFVFARGEGSINSRSAVYVSSLQGFTQRPIFGWGTERDVEGNTYPAGSHSEYIAVLYRQGLVGFMLFAGLLWSVWRMTRPPKGELWRQPEGSFLRYGRWFFVTSLINSIATDPAVDTTVYVMLWLIMGMLVAASLLIRRQISHENP